MVVLITQHTLSLCQAVFYSLKFVFTLKVPLKGLMRYFRKSINLSLAYVGFCSNTKFQQARNVGKAAFFCCAYDVCTDWKVNPEKWKAVFSIILNKCRVTKELKQLAIELYNLDILGQIPEDGLERGAISVEFITKMAGSYDQLSKQINLYEFGIACQVADDLLDIVQDHNEGSLNFIGQPNWRKRIAQAQLILSSKEAEELYKRGPILKIALNKGLRRATIKPTLDIAATIEANLPDFVK